MKYKLLLFLLILVFAGSVSAIDNTTDSSDGEILIDDDGFALGIGEDISLELSEDEDILDTSQISVREGESIQSAIDRASPGSTITVESGTYEEDVIVSKELSLIWCKISS